MIFSETNYKSYDDDEICLPISDIDDYNDPSWFSANGSCEMEVQTIISVAPINTFVITIIDMSYILPNDSIYTSLVRLGHHDG